MNLGSHIAVAHQLAPENPQFWLGAALPDLASIGGFRLLGTTSNSQVAAGVALHHQTDDAFHRDPWFTKHQRDLTVALTDLDIGRGPTRAIAHVGPELLLDGALAFHSTLNDLTTVSFAQIDQIRKDLAPLVTERESAWLRHLDRISAWVVPSDYHEPSAVAIRLHRILSTRSRLAFDTSQIGLVATTLEPTSQSILASGTDFVSAFTDQLNSSIKP